MSAQVTTSVDDTLMRVQCNEMWDTLGESRYCLTVHAVVPNVRLFVLCSKEGVEHIHRQICSKTTYKRAHCIRRYYG
jgi:hypothetical protein